MLASVAVAGREHQRADADRGRADRDDLARPQSIQRDAGDEAERRVAVVEEADHRRDAQRREAEGLRQLRHHHRRRRAQRVLVEVVHRRDQPRDRPPSLQRAAHRDRRTCRRVSRARRETARPPSDVSLYLEFISLAVSAIAFTVVSKSTRRFGRDLVARDHEAGPRLDRAERAALDARHLHEAGDRIAGHAEVVLQRRLRGVGDDLVAEVVRLRDEAPRPSPTRRRSPPGSRLRRPTASRCACTGSRSPPRRGSRRGSSPAAACGRPRRARRRAPA